MESFNRLFKDETVSKEITKRVFETTIDFIRNDNGFFDKLIEQISTKSGTTEAGINILKNGGLEGIIDQSFNEAISIVRK